MRFKRGCLIMKGIFDIVIRLPSHLLASGQAMTLYLQGEPFTFVESGAATGMPVAFIHGFPFSHEMWDPQISAVGQRHRAIAYDVRGHGGSIVGDGQYTIEGHVDDLIGLLDALHIARTVIVGLSMGGYIALRALERNPERFRAAVLCDTRSEADSNEGKIKRFASLAALRHNGAAAFAGGFVKNVFAPETFQTNPGAIEKIRTVISRMPVLAIAGTILALASRTDTTDSLAAIRVPTLILVGEHDVTTPPAAARAMHSRIAGSELHIIPHSAHMSNLENPEAFNSHLLPFLDRVASLNT